MLSLIVLSTLVSSGLACSNFYMNFTNHKISARTMDLGAMNNWTLTSWPKSMDQSEMPPLATWRDRKYGAVGVSGNWFGDDKFGFPSIFADSLNEKGLSCAMQALTVTQYQERSDSKTNVFAGLFCFYVAQNYASVYELQAALPNIAVWGPDVIAQHFVVLDNSGASLAVEFVGGNQHVYLDTNNGVNGKETTVNSCHHIYDLLVSKRNSEFSRETMSHSLCIPCRQCWCVYQRTNFRLASTEH